MILFYVPFPTHAEAMETAKHALLKKLTTCVNVFPKVESLYLWPNEEGIEERCESSEIVAIFKTSVAQKQQLSDFLLVSHSYNCPAIITIDANANEPFENWVTAQTTATPQ